MESVAILGEVKEKVGTTNARNIRKTGAVPCVMYGGDQNVHFTAKQNNLKDLIYTGKFLLAEIDVAGKKSKAIVKDIQFHPVTDRITHVDFQELVDGKKVVTDIPVVLKGFPVGVKSGGKLEQKLRKVTVKAFPKDLTDKIELDVTPLKLGKSIKVESILSGEIEIMNAPSLPVASVVIPRALRSAMTGEEEGEEGGEGGEEAKEEGEGKE